ncbi:omptin family outer membrane protease [Methylobacterium haplocladii]|uniref:Outer membrane protein beta-barrel domain-containing protein n=1 Tax=Methylobacterium haplocladii TaxID=1176176 RepID=A0A512IKG9_9HYPH|nr:outer membrane beta-barrel protein [Methylobacterium haplocladii]GEO98175.1 hypothetical protein MHA02_05630 [Methylobacterium haplocladii]GJD83578.1 hypothetical protein HPGCJGGD_1447 [Methylobacterium haplocladii]GLS58611.1 hypothetical protein GCM10007887_12750 [Methylobacterium haplocladii]
MRAALFALPLAGLSAAAFAADLPARAAPPPIAAPFFTWTGYYGGLFAGHGAIFNDVDPVCVSPTGLRGGAGCATVGKLRPDAGDFVAGSELGYNYQLTPGSGFVLGVEGDVQFPRLRGYGTVQGSFPVVGGGTTGPSIVHAGQRLDSFGTVRARVGYALDHTLVYVTGGVAGGEVRIDTNASFPGPIAYDGRQGGFRYGYAVGAGIEHAFTERLSAKVEGLYYDLGTRTVLGTDTLGGATGTLYGSRIETSGYLARVGLNYKLGNEIGDVLPGFGIINDILHPATAAPRTVTTWDFETGERYFYSTGTHRNGVSDPAGSRVNYENFGAHSGETFARLDHVPTGFFLKGFFGSGFVKSGRVNEQTLASTATHKVKDGDIAYATIDAGYAFLRGSNYRVGGFVGYQYFSELANGFGCIQNAGGAACNGAVAVPNSVKVLSEDAHWNAIRVGLDGEVRYDRFKLAVEGAYLPYVTLEGYDRHWLNPAINPTPQRGTGDGYFAQGLVSYDLSPVVSIGVGARYWKMNAESNRSSFLGAIASPAKFETDRYGGFIQIAHKIPDLGLSSLITK